MSNRILTTLTILLSLSLIGLVYYWLTFRAPDDAYLISQPADLNFFETVYKFPKSPKLPHKPKIIGGIITHHLLAADLIAEFYTNMENTDYDLIILLGPNHFSAGEADIITADLDWQTPFGILRADRDLISQLGKNDQLAVDNTTIPNDHSITSQIGFIKNTWPDVKIVPLMINPRVDQTGAESLASTLIELTKNKKNTRFSKC